MSLRKTIPEGGRIPKGYGVAWRANFGMKVICYPIILNVIIRWFVDVYWRIVYGWFEAKYETKLIKFRMEEYHKFREDYKERLILLKQAETDLAYREREYKLKRSKND